MGCGASVAKAPPAADPLVPIGNQPDLSTLRQIDEHVLLTPPEVTQSLHSLAEYFDSAATTEFERIRAVYKWITGNILFEPSATSSESRPQLTLSEAESVLRSRTGGRDGFAFVAFCLFRLLGIECKRLTGHAKDFGYSPLKPLTSSTRTNHDWYAVRMDGKWGFVDCVLGSGYFSESGVFERRETDFYFLTAPETFLNDHFPLLNSDPAASKPWQLMEKPIDLATFHARVRRREASYRLAVRPTSHSSALIDSTSLVKLKFFAARRPLSQFSAAFFNPETGEKCRSSLAAAVLDWRNREATIFARLPTSGVFWELRVCAATEQTAGGGDPEWLASYYLQSSGPVDEELFPEFHGFYGARLSPHACGFRKEFGSGSGFRIEADGGELSLQFPIYMPVRVSASLQFAKSLDQQSCSCMLEMDYLMLTVRIRMSRAGYYRLTLNSRDIYSVSGEYPEFASFLIRCSRPQPKLIAFPRTWHHQHQVKLVSHIEESIQVNTEAILIFKGLGKPLKQFMARFIHPRTGQRLSGEHIATVLDHLTNEVTVTARPPTSGTFWELQVFASTDEGAKLSDVIASYQILARQTSTVSPFPDFNGFYGISGNPQKCGFSADIGAQQGFRLKTAAGDFELRLPTLRPVRATAVLTAAKDRPGQQQQQLQHQVSTVESSSRFLTLRMRIWQTGFYRLTLSCSEVEGPGSLVEVANFLIECTMSGSAERPKRQLAESQWWMSDSDSGVSRDG